MNTDTPLSDKAIIELADKAYADDDLVIDHEAYVDRTEGGAWVDARVWVALDPEDIGEIPTSPKAPPIMISADAWKQTGNYVDEDRMPRHSRLLTTITVNGTDMHLEAYAIVYRDENDNDLTSEEADKRYDAGDTVVQHLLDDDADEALGELVGDGGWPIRETTIGGRAYCLIATPYAR